MEVPPLSSSSSSSSSVFSWFRNLPRKTRYICITGAGISQSAGIETFAGPQGIFKRLESQHPEIGNGEDVFNWNVVVERKSQPYLRVHLQECARLRIQALRILGEKAAPSRFHQWIHQQQVEKQMDCHLTFNIDNLDRHQQHQSQTNRTIHGHGSLATLRCHACQFEVEFTTRHARRMLRSHDGMIFHEDCRVTKRFQRKSSRQNWFRPAIVLYGSDPSAAVFGGDLVHKLNRQMKQYERNQAIHPILLIAGLSLRTTEIRSLIVHVASQIHALGGDVVWLNPSKPPSRLKEYLSLHAEMKSDEFVDVIEKMS